MKKICYIVPFFGHLPSNFNIWLNSCSTNCTIDWFVFTDDNSSYDYPDNVKKIYMSFDDFKNKLQDMFNFKIDVNNYHRISLFKPAYGELFYDYIKDYDFWGFCDVDLIWGDIRKFITDDILDKYDRIGFQGHSTLFKNTNEVNSRYKTIVPNKINYKDVFSGKIDYSFDEDSMDDIYNFLKIDYYKETNFAHLELTEVNFFLGHQDEKDKYKNKYQIFIWDKGKVFRKYLYNNKIYTEEFMYLHFFTRPMTYKAKNYTSDARYIIYPDELIDDNGVKIDEKFIKNKGKKKYIRFIIKKLYINRKKITLDRLVRNFIFLVFKDTKFRGKR